MGSSLFNERKDLTPLGLLLMVVGMACLLVALNLPESIHFARIGLPSVDWLRGLIFGLASAFNLMAVVLAVWQRRWQQN